jgi:hypothetical protein
MMLTDVPPVTEAHLQAAIEAECGRLGLLHHHNPDSRRVKSSGFPDSVIVGPGGILYRELKDKYGRLSPEQRRWGSKITRAGGDWAVWRPADWEDGTITRQLLALARQRDS